MVVALTYQSSAGMVNVLLVQANAQQLTTVLLHPHKDVTMVIVLPQLILVPPHNKVLVLKSNVRMVLVLHPNLNVQLPLVAQSQLQLAVSMVLVSSTQHPIVTPSTA